MHNITLILGSVRKGRKSHNVAHYLLERLADLPDISPHLLDLQAQSLPLLENRWHQQQPQDPALASFSRALSAADGLIFISPEYHGSYTGVLKNAIDHFWEEYARKPIGVVATGSGPYGGINASTEMQRLILSLGAFPMPYKLLVPQVSKAFDEQGKLLAPNLEANAGRFLREFIWFSQALKFAREQVSIADA